jgi:hypothetical protein
MSQSSQQPPPPSQQQLQQQLHLQSQAISHGPYLWSDKDVENALLWFPSSSTPYVVTSADAAKGGGRCSDDDDDNDVSTAKANKTIGCTVATQSNQQGCKFLRRLLHARGIWMPRPPHKGGRKSNKSKKRKASDIDADDNGGTRRREANSVTGGRTASVGNLLSAVLMGYYQLMLPSITQSTATASNTSGRQSQSTKRTLSSQQSDENDRTLDKGDNESERKLNSDRLHAERASTQLQNDLNSIILSRMHTNELYRASLHSIIQSTDLDNSLEQSGEQHYRLKDRQHQRDCTTAGIMEMMSCVIDKYMVHPTTCLRRVYASSLFDRLLSLCGDGASVENANNKDTDGNSNNSQAVHRFLQKLFGLAVTNTKIQEVVLLLLLEPARRSYIRQLENSSSCEGKELPQSHDLNESTLHQKDDSTKQTQSSKLELFPMLTSTSFWSRISQDELEKECVNLPMQSVAQFIVQTSIDSASSNDKKQSTVMDQADATPATISWWTLPSPLLCTISQLYFPLACGYIRYWIHAAVSGHEKLFRTADTNDTSKDAVTRIQQFCQTSERLHLLTSHIMNLMEKESQRTSFDDLLDNDVGDENDLFAEGENEAFQKTLAWRAIGRAVSSSKIS